MKQAPQDFIDGLLNFVSLAENERKLLAAELHDQLLSDLREASLITRRVLEDEPALPESARLGLCRIIESVDQATNEARRIMENLRPSVLDSFGLRSALEACLRRAAANSEPPFRPHLQISVDEEDLDRLEEEEQLALYRIVQEALSNISKHARATSVCLSLEREGEMLLVRVVDDGIGLQPSQAREQARGVENMRFRAQLIRASLGWKDNQEQGGTAVELRLRLREKA
jgi:two-component system, NarL family, sensor histidine kinase UhpB